MIIDQDLMLGLIVAAVLFLIFASGNRPQQPQIIQISFTPDPIHTPGSGCLVPIIIGLALLILLLAAPGK